MSISDTLFTFGWGVVAGICAIALLILTWFFALWDEIKKL